MSLIKKDFGGFPSLFDFIENDDFFNSRINSKLPAANIKDNENSYEIDLAAPGLEKEDFDIDLHNGVLTVSSEVKVEHEGTEKNYTRKEFNYSSMKRSFRMPEDASEDEISANYDKGVLKITINKKTAGSSGAKKISVS